MTRHCHYDVMIEWAADTSKVVQHKDCGKWMDCVYPPTWSTSKEYRIKPTPKPDVVRYCEVSIKKLENFGVPQSTMDNLRLTFDGETGKLIKAEVL